MGNNNDRKKELLLDYKLRKVTGGVCKITNTTNGRFLLKAATNIQGDKKRFEFSQKTNSCVFLKMQKDWHKYGAKAFSFEILEEVEMKDTQTLNEFNDDLKVLEEIWAEKFDVEKSY